MNEKTKPAPLSVDDLQNLYSELRGSRSGPAITDARAFFLERQMKDAHEKLLEAYETYRESRQRVLRQDPEQAVDAKTPDRDRQVRRLQRKQEKAREILKTFEKFLSELERLAGKEKAREEAKAQAAAAGASAAGKTVGRDAITKPMLKVFHELIGDRQLEFVSDRFDFKPLESVGDVVSGAVYLYRKGERCLLVHIQRTGDGGEPLEMVDLCNAGNRIELSAEQMVGLSVKRRLVLLLQR